MQEKQESTRGELLRGLADRRDKLAESNRKIQELLKELRETLPTQFEIEIPDELPELSYEQWRAALDEEARNTFKDSLPWWQPWG